MSRTCVKTACGAPAVAACAYNYMQRLVWIAPLAGDQAPASYELCETHADSLKAPKGWTVLDRRLLPPSQISLLQESRPA